MSLTRPQSGEFGDALSLASFGIFSNRLETVASDHEEADGDGVKNTFLPSQEVLYRIRMANPRQFKLQFLHLVKLHYGSILLTTPYLAFPSYPTICLFIRQAWGRAKVDIDPHGARLTRQEITKVSTLSSDALASTL